MEGQEGLVWIENSISATQKIHIQADLAAVWEINGKTPWPAINIIVVSRGKSRCGRGDCPGGMLRLIEHSRKGCLPDI